jgi:hypothetical protein
MASGATVAVLTTRVCAQLARASPFGVAVIYDVAAGNITALRLYFTGPAQP